MTATPYLAVDATVLDANIAAMASSAAARGLSLRPHAKTHKCLEIARRQLSAGAVGLTVATVGEAEIFAEVCQDIFIAYPLWADDAKGARLRALVDAGVRVTVGVDSAVGAAQLAVAAGAIDVLVEVDSGHHRSGCPAADAGAVAAAATEAGLTVRGAFTFPGHGYTPGAAEGVAEQEELALAVARDRLAARGLSFAVLSGGSTPTAPVAHGGVLSELRPGVYVFNDAQQLHLGTCSATDLALWAVGTVVSAPTGGRIVLDTGSKVLGADRPSWLETFGFLPDYPGAVVVQLSEHHAVVELPPTVAAPAHGDRVRVVPNHVCNTVNLADEFVIEAAGRPTGRWLIAARGANR